MQRACFLCRPQSLLPFTRGPFISSSHAVLNRHALVLRGGKTRRPRRRSILMPIRGGAGLAWGQRASWWLRGGRRAQANARINSVFVEARVAAPLGLNLAGNKRPDSATGRSASRVHEKWDGVGATIAHKCAPAHIRGALQSPTMLMSQREVGRSQMRSALLSECVAFHAIGLQMLAAWILNAWMNARRLFDEIACASPHALADKMLVRPSIVIFLTQFRRQRGLYLWSFDARSDSSVSKYVLSSASCAELAAAEIAQHSLTFTFLLCVSLWR